MLAVAFTDELATGVVPSSAPELIGTFGLTPARAAGWTLFAFGVLAAALEPPLLAIAHGRRERLLRTAGLALMALAALAAALAPSYALFLAALAIYGPASGLGTNLAESALVCAYPGRSEVILARWSLLGLLAMPDRPHVVLATGSLFGTLELALPLLVGVVADRVGVFAAMLLLFVQPLGVVVAAAAARRREALGPASRREDARPRRPLGEQASPETSSESRSDPSESA